MATVMQENQEIDRVSKFVTGNTRFLGMGSSYFASLYAKYLLQEVAHVDVEVGLASEFVHYPTSVRSAQVFFVVSQSGESIETVKTAHFLRHKHAKIVAVTNQPESSLAAVSDMTLLMHAGEERASATKTFTSTLALFRRLAFSTATRKNLITSTLLEKSDAAFGSQDQDAGQAIETIQVNCCSGKRFQLDFCTPKRVNVQRSGEGSRGGHDCWRIHAWPHRDGVTRIAGNYPDRRPHILAHVQAGWSVEESPSRDINDWASGQTIN